MEFSEVLRLAKIVNFVLERYPQLIKVFHAIFHIPNYLDHRIQPKQ